MWSLRTYTVEARGDAKIRYNVLRVLTCNMGMPYDCMKHVLDDRSQLCFGYCGPNEQNSEQGCLWISKSAHEAYDPLAEQVSITLSKSTYQNIQGMSKAVN
jgi:hypothetical protein